MVRDSTEVYSVDNMALDIGNFVDRASFISDLRNYSSFYKVFGNSEETLTS